YADSGIPDLKRKELPRIAASFSGLRRLSVNPQRYGAGGRKLDRVPQEVEEYLHQPRLVADDPQRQVRVELDFEPDRPRPQAMTDVRGNKLQGVLEGKWSALRDEVSGVDLRLVENIVNQAQEGLGACADRMHVLGLLGIGAGLLKEP